MLKNESGKISRKISPGAALAVFIIGILAIAAAGVLLIVRPGMNKSDNTVQASVIPFAARLDKMDGDVGIARQTDTQQGDSYQGWTKATVNAPISLGDRIYSSAGSKAAISINRNNYIRLNSNTSLDVISLSQGNTQLALREGACVFDVGELDSGETYEIATPNGAVDFTQPGLYQVGINDGGDTVVSVLNGACQIAGLAGSGEISKGQLITLAAAEAADAFVSDLSPEVAAPIVDDYYSYRYRDDYDGRYSDYNAYESDPNYYHQSYRQSASYQYIPEDAEIAGVEDLDDYGDWQDVPNYGQCWRPRSTSADWAPYRDGYWSEDHTLGLTWVSNERWGWAPYHYGRWAHVNQQWFWVPAEITRHATYAPALVAFIAPRADTVGWVPLGPGDAYVPRYYDRNYQPRYAGSRSDIDRYVNVTNVVNYHDESAITVVSINQFTRVIIPGTVLRPDRDWREHARPIADPYAVPTVRQIARTLESSRPVVAVPLESQRSFDRPVMVRHQPVRPSSTTNVAETLKVHAVPDAAVKQKLRMKNVGAVTTTQANGIPVSPAARESQQTTQERDARINALAAQAAQGNKAAKREMRQLQAQQQEQQQQDAKAAKAERKAAAQQTVAKDQQQVNPQKAERQATRQQAQQAAEQSKQQNKQQAEQQRQTQAGQQVNPQKAQKQAARQQAQKQQAQQAEQQRQAQSAQQAEQQKAQKRAARQQSDQAAAQAQQQRKAQAAQQQTQASQQAEQQKAQKQAARQQAQQAAAQAEQQRAAQQVNAQKAQRQAARQQSQQADQQAAQKQAQQEAARQQAQQEQKRIQKQAQQQAAQQQQQQAQQQKQQQKQQRRAEAQPEAPKAQPSAAQPNPAKAEKRAAKDKNKNSNQ